MNRENVEGILGTYRAHHLSRAEVYRLEHIYYTLDVLGKDSIIVPSLTVKEEAVLLLQGYTYETIEGDRFRIRKVKQENE